MVFLTAGHLIPDRYVLVDAHQQPVDFTQGEYGLLLALAQNSRRVLICEQLLDLIHGETTEVFDRTIDVLIIRLCRKIEINPHWCFASPIQRLASFWSNLS